MRPRRSERRAAQGAACRLIVAAALCGGAVDSAGAQDNSGASFLHIPVGARLVGLGGAVVADPSGAEAVLANPAGLARLTAREASLNAGFDAQTSRYLATAVLPSRVLGTFAVSAYLFDAGSFENTNEDGVVVGSASVQNQLFSASYALRAGRLTYGLTYKYVRYRFNCSGLCIDPNNPGAEPLAEQSPSAPALDLGVQLDLLKSRALHLGLATRNLGFKLQVKDRAQADPLPSQLVGGVAYDVANLDGILPRSSVRLLGEAAYGLRPDVSSAFGLGAELRVQNTVSLRGGYRHLEGGGGYNGPTVGFGYARSRLAVDIARQLGAGGLLAESPPTYVGVRFGF